MRATPAIAAGALMIALALPAAAQVSRLDAMLEQGVTLREAGRDEEALTVFREAWEETHSARARAQIAMAEHALARWVEAHVHLTEALQSSDPWVQHNRAALRGLLAAIERQFGSLEVRGRPEGAEVRINGTAVGTVPMAPLRVASGAVRLEVSAPGYDPMVREITVGASGVTRETVQLAPRVAAPVPASRRGNAVRTLAWVSAGAGAALLAGSAVAFGLHESTVERYDGQCLGRLAPIAVETPSCQDDRDLEGTLRTLSTAGLIAGGALGVLSVVLFLAEPLRPDGARARVVCGAGPGSVGVACGGVF